MTFAYLASLQFVEFVALSVPKTLDILEREMSIYDMILFKAFSSLHCVVREDRLLSQLSFPA